jgi:CBS domain containing-hemolysin-like protein
VARAAILLLDQNAGRADEALPPSVGRVLAHHGRIVVLLSLFRLASLLTLGLALAVLGIAAGAGWGLVMFLGVVALAMIVLAQGVAQAVGQRYCIRVAKLVSPALAGVDRVLGPALALMERLGGIPIRLSGSGLPTANGGQPALNEEVTVEEEVREADPDERRMIRGILHLEDATVREIMVPRVALITADVSMSLSDVAAIMVDSGHSRVPVYRDSIDDVVGIAHARDLLQSIASPEQKVELADIVRPLMFIPDSKPLDELLQEFQERRITLALVVDEYGGTEGVVTIEDLLEEIVGEIEDEFGTEEPPITRVNEREVVIDGRVTLDELNELFQTTLEGDGFDTVAGLLSIHLGRIPASGDVVSLDSLTIEVISTAGHRVRRVRVAQGE